jgi:glycosyltransferase involved in cell wall biosynthesis
MRILIASNAPFCNTGYGTQTNTICKILLRLGHEVAVLSQHGLMGATLDWEGVRIFPPGHGDTWGGNIIRAHVQAWRANLVINFHDLWALPRGYGEQIPVPWVGLFPIDHDPPAPRQVDWARAVNVPVVYSRFALEAMDKVGVRCEYVPHAIDTDTFCPGDKEGARERLHWPKESFIAAIVASNKGPRKAYPHNVEAFARFAERYPALDARLYVHCEYMRSDGYDIPALAEALGITKRVMYVNRYKYAVGLTESYMVDVYRGADVLLAASHGEGFGLPIAEAQACGCPVITTDFTSMTELTVNGVATKPAGRWWTPLGSWQAWPDIDAIEGALWALSSRNERYSATEAKRGREHMVAHYGIPAVTMAWRTFLEGVG